MIDYNSVLSRTVVGLKKSGIRKFFGLLDNPDMKDVVALTVGQPDFVTPWHIRDAGIESLQRGKTYYTSNAGDPQLRTEICNYLKRRFDLSYHPDQTLVTVGGSEAIDLAIRAVVEPGDEVIIPTPSFVCYEPITRMTGGVPVIIETKIEDCFKLTPEALRAAITPRTKMLVLPYPNNPTGAIMTREELEGIAAVLRDTNIVILSDEIYAELTFGRQHTSIASIDGMWERTIIASGFSKAYAMTGWRMGYLAAPQPLLNEMLKIHQYGIMCASRMGQVAALEALQSNRLSDYEDVRKMRESYDRRRRLMVEGFRAMGLECFEPRGAFYVFPSIKSTGLTSEEFCTRLLQEHKIACVPGTAFGASGEGHIRCSYATSIDKLSIALERMEAFVKSL